MAPSTITTEIETPVSISSKTPRSSENHDVSTTLNYTKRPGPEGLEVIDSGVPESEGRFAKRDDLRDVQNVVIKDIRGREKDFRWDVEGFHLMTEELVKKVTGASKIVVYLGRNRNKLNAEGDSMRTAQSPSHGVHTDLTIASCRYVLKNAIPDDEEVERLLNRRFIVVNVWRPIKQIRRDPLGVCNWKSVNPAVDIYNDRRVTSEGVMEFGVPIFNEKHEWYYLSGQKADETLLFKQLDSHPDTNITLLHSAFVEPKYVDYPARESIEMKISAFFDEE